METTTIVIVAVLVALQVGDWILTRRNERLMSALRSEIAAMREGIEEMQIPDFEEEEFGIYIMKHEDNDWGARIENGDYHGHEYQATSLVQLMHTIGYDLARMQSEANQDSEETQGEQY